MFMKQFSYLTINIDSEVITSGVGMHINWTDKYVMYLYKTYPRKKDPDIKTHAKETNTYIHTQQSDTHGFTHAWGPDTKEFHPFKHRNKYPWNL